MQIIKYFILFLIFILSNVIGKSIAKKYTYRLEELKEMKSALNIFKTKIEFTYEPIPEIFLEISKNTSKTIANIFEMAKLEKPDLILSDVMMPKMSGFQFCEAVKKEESIKATPFIILTAKGQENDIKTGESLGADDYITKPFSPKALLEKVAEILGE